MHPTLVQSPPPATTPFAFRSEATTDFSESSRYQFTRRLETWSHHRRGRSELLQRISEELRKLAAQQLLDNGPFQSTTGLLQTAYQRLVDPAHTRLEAQSDFYSLAARAMRRLLVRRARRHLSGKRVGPEPVMGSASDMEILGIDAAVSKLSEVESSHARLAELRYFGGLSLNEAAEVLGCTDDVARRDWMLVRLWIFRHLNGSFSLGSVALPA